ncbi:glycosyltransferase family 2 protein [Salmonirosea aquatica]|uniref:Glycosyltransferase n=1 Tax=Salmonirosea aquatica TaxID=2654236 RepID=A0A7C9F5Z3_9BACT|nr:glycosyltransferase [Cytophagaceae bacterium SJW1-29]
MKSLETYASELQSFLQKPAGLVKQDSTYPKLSIITPSFNQGKYLERTILSVLNQQYPNLEYIIIDGGSTDESLDVIKKYEKYLAYWVSEPDKGQVDALNKGFIKATGDWIGFQNSDDVYFPGTFDRFGIEARRSANVDLLYGDLFMITPDDRVTELLKTLPYSLTCQLIEGMQIHNQSLFFKKSLLDQYGSFDPEYRFAFDYEFITRFTTQSGVRAKRINGLAGALRIHDEAKSSTIAQIGRQEHEQIQIAFGKYNTSFLPEKMQYLYCRLRKLAYLFGQNDWNYIAHRKSLRKT